MAASKRIMAGHVAERKRMFETLEDRSSSDQWSSTDDEGDGRRTRPAVKRARRTYDYGPHPVATVNTNSVPVTGTVVPVPPEADTPAVARFLFHARDFPRLKSALVATAAAWVGPAGGVHASMDDAHVGHDVDDDVLLTVRAVDADTAVRAVRALWWRFAGRGGDLQGRWTADVLADSEVVSRAVRADAAWRPVDDWDTRDMRLVTTRQPRSVRVVRVCATPAETMRRVRRLMDLDAVDPDVAGEAMAKATAVTPRPSPSATPGWAPSSPYTDRSSGLRGVGRLDLSDSSSSSEDERDGNAR